MNCPNCSAPLHGPRCEYCETNVTPVIPPAVRLKVQEPLYSCTLVYRHKGINTLGRHHEKADVPVRVKDNLKFMGISRRLAQIVLESSRATLVFGRAADGGGYYARDASRPVVFTVEEALQIVLEIKNLRCNRNKDGAYLIKP